MNLKTHIKPELWLTLSNTYEAENYSHAILDAMHYLSEIIRDKANLTGDGVSLVGQAFGSNSPKLRVNKLQTQSERNVQQGLEQMLRGLYMGIRNPRSHEQSQDTKDTADAVIYFINYLLGIIDQSQEPFTIEKFLSRVFDRGFVASDRYAKLLVEEIPARKRLDTLIEIYRNKQKGDGQKLSYIVEMLLRQLSDDAIKDFLTVVSEELKVTNDNQDIQCTLQMLPQHLWPEVSEVARLRTENKLIQAIYWGQVTIYDVLRRDKQGLGVLGTWASNIFEYFELKQELRNVFLKRLENVSPYERDFVRYITKFFIDELPVVFTESVNVPEIFEKTDTKRCIEAIANHIKDDHKVVRRHLRNFIHRFPEEWQKEFVSLLEELTDADNPEVYFFDGTPFLDASYDYTITDIDVYVEEPEDEIPF